MKKTVLICVACALALALASEARAAGSEKKASSGNVAKDKFKVLWNVMKKRQGLEAIKAAARELAAAQRLHGPREKMAKNADYVAKSKTCADVIDKVVAAESTYDAFVASRRIGRSCVDCHQVYNKQKK